VTRTTIALAASAAIAGGAALAVSAQGQAQQSQTIVFTASQPRKRDMKQIDVKPRGESLGDQVIGAVTVRLDGKPVGRLINQCTAADRTYQGQMCTITLLTRDGQITAQGAGEHRPLPGRGGNPGTGDTFAITGGTGGYAGAIGTVTPRSTSNGETITVSLDGR
jgi:Na+-translocating ferredoxin:NAD+ oxidoreductase RnfG subunit